MKSFKTKTNQEKQTKTTPSESTQLPSESMSEMTEKNSAGLCRAAGRGHPINSAKKTGRKKLVSTKILAKRLKSPFRSTSSWIPLTRLYPKLYKNKTAVHSAWYSRDNALQK